MKTGNFQSMKLDKSVVKAIYRKGYKVPTPIQRKTIPIILDGRDVVAMARTGSGKTAAFLIPIVEKLKSHKTQKGARALILSPTRELAVQTFKFAREFVRFTDLKCETILGGDSMERQFAKLHDNPDIIVATPGRLLHVAIEMDLKFSEVEMVVFDEADRLFEMGFKDQLNEILSRLSSHRQTLLFSATLPQIIVDFTNAGLNNPELVRLDTENQINENLKLHYLACRTEDKLATLIHLLKCVIGENEQTIVFLPTRHHIEYIQTLFDDHFNIKSTYLYSSLDAEARKINVQMFSSKKVSVLLVTDLAARGVDIPMLDNVINYNFPSRTKLFVHRVGRTARAGRSGTAYSIISNDETAYLYSLSLFLNKSFSVADRELKPTNEEVGGDFYGSVPQNIIDEWNESIEKLNVQFCELESMKRVCDSAYKQYLKTRETADGESIQKAKSLLKGSVGIHPIFSCLSKSSKEINTENARSEMLGLIKSYKPNATIFELNKSKKNNFSFEVPRGNKYEKFSVEKKKLTELESEKTFDSNIGKFKDTNFYIKRQSNDFHSEKGLQLEKSFDAKLKESVLDFDGDENGQIFKQKNQLKWDRKKKKFIQNGSDELRIKKIKTESGNLINASYKSGLYEKWKQKSRIQNQTLSTWTNGEDELENNQLESSKINFNVKKVSNQNQSKRKPPKQELKSKQQILKEKERLQRIQSYQKKKHAERHRKTPNKQKQKSRPNRNHKRHK